MSDGRLIFGGSFNPLHCGHMRLAIECLGRLRLRVKALEFVPCAAPPHKDGSGLLPFPMRAEIISAVCQKFPAMRCNDLEAHRSGPSYTWETLAELGDRENLYFLLGSQDFAMLPQWFRGAELVQVANLVVVPRGGMNQDDFIELCFQFFGAMELVDPRAAQVEAGVLVMRHASGQEVFWLPVPYLDISASYIRQSWLGGGNVDYLVPKETLDILKREQQAARTCWEGSNASCSM